MDAGDDISQALTTLVRTTPGVQFVFATKPLVAALVSTTVRAATGQPTQVHLVTVTTGQTGIEILVSIGVDGTEPAPVVSRRVYDSITAFLSSEHQPAADRIILKVSSVGPLG